MTPKEILARAIELDERAEAAVREHTPVQVRFTQSDKRVGETVANKGSQRPEAKAIARLVRLWGPAKSHSGSPEGREILDRLEKSMREAGYLITERGETT